MINYKPTSFTNGKRERPIRTIKMQIDEKPVRKEYNLISPKSRYKFITMIKSQIRTSPEYREYIEFLKKHRGMFRSHVLPKATMESGKHYSIEIHHEPFTLFEIIDIVLTKRQTQGENLNTFQIMEEVMELHYDDKIGLIPLDITSHELCEKGNIFIPLQDIYGRYDKFYDEYSALCEIPDKIENKLEIKISLSEKLESGVILSDMLHPEFTYLEVNGQKFPEVPKEWGEALSINNQEIFLKSSK